MHKYNIEYIVEHGTPEDMEHMKQVFEDAVFALKGVNYDAYIEAEYKLHCIAHHGHLGEKAAKCWVDKMVNKDGTKGAHWTWEQTEQVRKDKGLQFDSSDWYAVLNMMYSDYYHSKLDTSMYIEMAKDWLSDSDVGKKKTLKYYYFVVK
jgi:hypothetical protein